MTNHAVDSSDFYSYDLLLDDDDRELLHAVRDFVTSDVAPIVTEHWSRGTFPFGVIDGMRKLGIAGVCPITATDAPGAATCSTA
jgi:glutaryl-CoA dehydrogenase